MAALTEDQTRRLRELMQQRRERLIGEIRDVLSRTGEHPYGELAEVPDIGDQSIADLLIDVDNAMVHRDVEEIRVIDAAFQRMDEGSYGICVDCGQEVDFERLSAFPTAKRCFPCQVRHEKTYAHDPMSKL